MRKFCKTLAWILLVIISYACSKSEKNFGEADRHTESMDEASEVSMAASQTIEGKEFLKSASVDMEVKNAYDATVYIEHQLKALGGYVTSSHLEAEVLSEKVYETSDKEAVLVKKFRTENRMQVRVPSSELGQFLESVHNKSVFLNTRLIDAKDISIQKKNLALKQTDAQTTQKVINAMKPDEKKVEETKENLTSAREQKIAQMTMQDLVDYSVVDIYIKEPQTRVASIKIENTNTIENQYGSSFWLEAKHALVNGLFMIKMTFVMLLNIWPFIVIAILVGIVYRKRKQNFFRKGKE
ncbi:DUF4349 domain-containing protein [Riemerella columbina]|uniref:DUF4349 domain-containing protein n=1 Tax=Riemerella columbina TaxID=103810 RepID=UPI0003644875|nr:DUF4349 domain-containing protein [Riemerella columbina]